MLCLQRKVNPGLQLFPQSTHTPRFDQEKQRVSRHCFILLLPGAILLLVVPTCVVGLTSEERSTEWGRCDSPHLDIHRATMSLWVAGADGYSSGTTPRNVCRNV